MEPPVPMEKSEQDFTAIYESQHGRVLRLCRYLLNSADAAEDAAHEVFLRAQARISTYDPSLPLSSWLSGIATNYCIDVLRRRGTEKKTIRSGIIGESGFPVKWSRPVEGDADCRTRE